MSKKYLSWDDKKLKLSSDAREVYNELTKLNLIVLSPVKYKDDYKVLEVEQGNGVWI